MKIITVSQLLYELDASPDLSWTQEDNLVKSYAKKHNLYTYCRPRNGFSKTEAVEYAIRCGFAGVILENLS